MRVRYALHRESAQRFKTSVFRVRVGFPEHMIWPASFGGTSPVFGDGHPRWDAAGIPDATPARVDGPTVARLRASFASLARRLQLGLAPHHIRSRLFAPLQTLRHHFLPARVDFESVRAGVLPEDAAFGVDFASLHAG